MTTTSPARQPWVPGPPVRPGQTWHYWVTFAHPGGDISATAVSTERPLATGESVGQLEAWWTGQCGQRSVVSGWTLMRVDEVGEG